MPFRHVCLLLLVLLSANQGVASTELPTLPGVTGGEFTYTADSLASISSRFGVLEKVLARDNGLRPPYRLKTGDRLKVDNRHLIPEALPEGIVINIPQRMLFLFRDAKLAASYPVALGRHDWQTPTGSFFVAQLEKNKTWCVPPSIQEEMRRAGKPVITRVAPGPDNPLGGYWIGLSLPGYGIHATIAPASVYRMRTHGCIRLHPEDAAALYARVSLKMPVKIIYAPVLLSKLEDGRRVASSKNLSEIQFVASRKNLSQLACSVWSVDRRVIAEVFNLRRRAAVLRRASCSRVISRLSCAGFKVA